MNVSIEVIEVLFNNHSFIIYLFIYLFIYLSIYLSTFYFLFTFCGIFQVRTCVRRTGSYAPGLHHQHLQTKEIA